LIPLNYSIGYQLSSWILDKTILALQVPFKKALAQSFTRHYCSSIKQIYTSWNY